MKKFLHHKRKTYDKN